MASVARFIPARERSVAAMLCLPAPTLHVSDRISVTTCAHHTPVCFSVSLAVLLSSCLRVVCRVWVQNDPFLGRRSDGDNRIAHTEKKKGRERERYTGEYRIHRGRKRDKEAEARQAQVHPAPRRGERAQKRTAVTGWVVGRGLGEASRCLR